MCGNESGQAVVEFSLAALLVLTLIFGVVDFGRAVFAYDSVTNAARLGTRWAMVRGSACGAADCPATSATIQSYVRTATPGIGPTQLTVTTTWSTGAGCTDATFHGPGCVVTVQTQYPFHFVLALPQITMSSTSKMVISQ